jgi:hypothetical protein
MAAKKKTSSTKARRVKNLPAKDLDVKKAGQVRGGSDTLQAEMYVEKTALAYHPK